MKIQFWGAARSVTGSMHLLTVGESQILLDCGLFQGRRAETYERNRTFPFEASKINATILSHAHIDHAGNIPNLVRNGFTGPIYATSATRNLSNVMLYDSAYVQERDASYMNRRHEKQGKPPVLPLYSTEDVFASLSQFIGINYNQTLVVEPGIKVTMKDAGHLLGSAGMILELEEKGKKVRLGFSGDVGRKNLPILKDPEPLSDIDFLILESTYGGRIHEPVEKMNRHLLDVVKKTIQKGGKVIIPSFSVGRSQEILYVLFQLHEEGLLPSIPVFVDSPLTVNATEVFRLHPECFDKEMLAYLHDRDDPFGFSRLTYIRSVEQSKKLNSMKESAIIIAGSGMCEAGRILHHLFNNIENPMNTIAFVGFQAEHTLGRKILERQPEVSILGEVKKVRAEVAILNSFSGHAGQDELLEYAKHAFEKKLKKIFLVHGELDQAEALSTRLRSEGSPEVAIPVRGEIAELIAG